MFSFAMTVLLAVPAAPAPKAHAVVFAKGSPSYSAWVYNPDRNKPKEDTDADVARALSLPDAWRLRRGRGR